MIEVILGVLILAIGTLLQLELAITSTMLAITIVFTSFFYIRQPDYNKVRFCLVSGMSGILGNMIMLYFSNEWINASVSFCAEIYNYSDNPKTIENCDTLIRARYTIIISFGIQLLSRIIFVIFIFLALRRYIKAHQVSEMLKEERKLRRLEVLKQREERERRLKEEKRKDLKEKIEIMKRTGVMPNTEDFNM